MRVGHISEQKEKKYPFINVLIQKYIHFKKEFKMDRKAEAVFLQDGQVLIICLFQEMTLLIEIAPFFFLTIVRHYSST